MKQINFDSIKVNNVTGGRRRMTMNIHFENSLAHVNCERLNDVPLISVAVSCMHSNKLNDALLRRPVIENRDFLYVTIKTTKKNHVHILVDMFSFRGNVLRLRPCITIWTDS